jgi:hypothetical protein
MANNLQKLSLILLIFSVSSCNGDKRYVFSADKNERPITGCLEMGVDGFFAAAIAMNCQKSVIENIMLCSNGRTLSYYHEKTECDKVNSEFKEKFGSYSLSTDPDA